MDAISIWGAIIALITGAGSLSAMKAWQIIGRIEGTTDRIAERMDRHSGKIDEHDLKLALLPGRVESIEKELERVEKKLDLVLLRLERGKSHGSGTAS